MKRLFYTFVVLLLVSVDGNAQEIQYGLDKITTDKQKGYFNILEAGLSMGHITEEFEEPAQGNPSSYHGRTIGGTFRMVNGIFINPNFSLGLGAGYERNYKNKNTHHNGLLLYLDGRFYAKKFGNTLFAYTSVGVSSPLGDNGIRGTFFSPGVGYKLKTLGCAALNFSIGYNRINRSSSGSGAELFSNASFKIGLLF